MKLEVNIDKKYFLIIIAVIVVAVGIVYVIAYGTSNPPVFGHSSGEVDVTIGEMTKTLQQAIDDGDLIGEEVVSGVVMAFNLTNCPTGWSELIDARGRTVIGKSSSYPLGSMGGEATHTLTVAEMPSHRHGGDEKAWVAPGSPGQIVVADDASGNDWYTTYVGGGQPHNTMQPYIALLYCVKD